MNVRQSIFLIAVIGFASAAQGIMQVREIAPASVQDIVTALGPDAKGLQLSAEKLPDVFTLTASRLDEDSKKFIVDQPYTSGRWKGGHAVIEYARDLSYTIISVYDKDGHRQRIYSVTSKPKIVQASSPEQLKKYVNSEDFGVTPESTGEKTEQAADRSEGEVKEEPPPPPPTSTMQTTPVPRHRSKTVRVAALPSGVTGRTSKSTVVMEGGDMTMEETAAASRSSKSRSKSKSNASAASAPPAESGGGSNYVWDDDKGAYVPVHGKSAGRKALTQEELTITPPESETESGGTESVATSRKSKKTKSSKSKSAKEAKAEQELTITPPESEAPPSPPSSKKQKKRKSGETSATSEAELAAAPSFGSSGGAASAAASHSAVVMEEVPSTDELLRGAGAEGSLPSPPPPSSKSSKSSRSSAKSQPAAIPEPEPLPPPSSRGKSSVPARATPPPTEEPTMSDRATPVSSGNASSMAKPEKEEPAPKPVTTLTPEERAALNPPPPPPKASRSSKRQKGAEAPAQNPNDLTGSGLATGPDTTGSDQWVPKATKAAAPPEEEVPPPPTQVAMVPKRAPVDNSLESILKEAAENAKASAPTESESWVPKKAGSAGANNSEAEINAELAKVRAMDKPAVKPLPKVRKDINNPEEGVLPVNQFEKFSGPRYGRHREYERRFFYGKRPKAPVKEYDFYVDEVDRKKEIHNVYYYKRDAKVPKLVAVERHENVTFMSNYDVDKEDKGKIVTY